MPVPKFDRKFVKLIAEEAKVPEAAVWINLPKTADEKVQVIFWTAKMSSKQLVGLASMNAANYRGSYGGGCTRRQKVASFLEGFNAEGWLTKADPREAQPHELHPLTGSRAWCNCGEKLLTSQEIQAGKCAICCPER
jgi:hypothetical protein